MRKYNVKSKDEILTVTEKLKQQLQAESQRIRRFDKRQKFFHLNKKYTDNAKKFYRELGKRNVMIHEIPEKETVESFWSGIRDVEKQHNNNAEWIKQIENSNQNILEQLRSDISIEETKIAIQK